MNSLTSDIVITKLKSKLHALIRHAKASHESEQRAEPRYPFFQPITISRGSENISALSKDISLTGIGVLHSVPLPEGRLVVGIPCEFGNVLHLLGEVVWSKTFGGGWHLSGIQFIDEVDGK